MIQHQPRSTLTYTLLPYTTLFRSPARPRLGRQVGVERQLPVVQVRGQHRRTGELGHGLQRHQPGEVLRPPGRERALRSHLQRLPPPEQSLGQLHITRHVDRHPYANTALGRTVSRTPEDTARLTTPRPAKE